MKIKLLFVVWVLSFCLVESQSIITTVAGNGNAGFSGDGGQATSAELYNPWRITIDTSENMYFVDESNFRVREINTMGVINTIAGTGVNGFSGDGGLSTSAQLSFCAGVTVNIAGNIFITDKGNNRIRKINTSGIITTFAGNGLMGYSGDGGQATIAKLWQPQAITFDAIGNLYFIEAQNACRVRMINTSGIISTIIGSSSTSGYSGDGGLANIAQIFGASDLTFDSFGNMYIADGNNHRIRKVNSSGIITTICGTGTPGFSGDGGLATSAQLNYPTGIIFDMFGNLYISDQNNNRIREVNTSGIITTVVGTGTGGYSGDGNLANAAQIWNPFGLVFDKFGNLFICDNPNNRIRKVTNIAGISSYSSQNHSFSISPNPSSSNITLTSSKNMDEIKIANVLGQEVSPLSVSPTGEKVLSMNISTLENGIYFITITSGKESSTQKLIVQH